MISFSGVGNSIAIEMIRDGKILSMGLSAWFAGSLALSGRIHTFVVLAAVLAPTKVD